MRTLTALVLIVLPGCSLFEVGGVEGAVITQVTVEDLDLSRPWDSPFTDDLPDIYANATRSGDGFLGEVPRWRTRVIENVDSLPLGLRASGSEDMLWDLDRPLRIDVADEDFAGDDLMFSTGTITFADHYAGEERGEASRLTFENVDGRITVFARWE